MRFRGALMKMLFIYWEFEAASAHAEFWVDPWK
jgi:hypothetical protein